MAVDPERLPYQVFTIRLYTNRVWEDIQHAVFISGEYLWHLHNDASSWYSITLARNGMQYFSCVIIYK